MTRTTWLLLLLALAFVGLLALKPHRRVVVTPAVADIFGEAANLQPNPIHELRHRNLGGGDEYLVRNLVGGRIEVSCWLAQAENVQSFPPMPLHLVVPALAETRLAELRSIRPDESSRASVECKAMVGDPGPRPVEGVEYLLPFYRGTEFTLDQGFNGSFSHHDAETRYSLDFGVPEGTPVLAARAGVVMQVAEDFSRSGTDAERFADRANFIRVVHEDGSMAIYAHLAPHSSVRRPGERVAAGEMLGKSGNTGLSTGPHLHFSVQRNAGFALRAVPFAMTGVIPDAARN